MSDLLSGGKAAPFKTKAKLP